MNPNNKHADAFAAGERDALIAELERQRAEADRMRAALLSLRAVLPRLRGRIDSILQSQGSRP